MVWRVLALFLVTLSAYAPVMGAELGAQTCACAQVQACCDHCNCLPEKSCQASHPMTIDQSAVAKTAEVSARVDVQLFAFDLDRHSIVKTDSQALFHLPESPPVDTSQAPQAVLCLWLI